MNIKVFVTDDGVFSNCDCIKGIAFKPVAPRGKSVHMVHDFTALKGKSAQLTATFADLQYSSVCSTVLNASHHEYTS